jgi:vesicle-associated membrane protein 7
VLDALRQRFSNAPQSDPVKAAQAELGAVKDIMTQNVEQILSRGERIELLMDRTGEAANQSLAFRRRAKDLR